jgi:hypothetical protein
MDGTISKLKYDSVRDRSAFSVLVAQRQPLGSHKAEVARPPSGPMRWVENNQCLWAISLYRLGGDFGYIINNKLKSTPPPPTPAFADRSLA